VCESVRAAYLGRSESPISDAAPDRKAPRWLNATVPTEVLDALSWARIELHEVADAFPALMRDFGLSSNDAVHVATAEDTGAEAIVTTDTDFGVLPSSRLRVLTSSSLVASCRNKRPR
jgi:predicted nucleic acid-binding protein